MNMYLMIVEMAVNIRSNFVRIKQMEAIVRFLDVHGEILFLLLLLLLKNN